MFSQLIDDYKNNNKFGLILNVLKAFTQLEVAEVDPSLLAYSVILNKDPGNYRCYTPQHKIGKSLNKEPGSLIKYYKSGQQEDGYKGHSTNYQDLNINIYKTGLWNLIKEVLRLLDCDVQRLEDQIFPTGIGEEDNYDAMLSDTICLSRSNKKNDANDRKAKNIQRNESLDKYPSLPQSVLVLVRPSIY